ncbi:hypothetical protein HJG54_23420 [Leptolyngbya sp. NK1-12]|uniref:Small integral membrane protein n=1 Tax=Leptolyngbya sp. NK1-12 TaxID=2547451 RepID=A0AA96WHB5_9CYAN|nr:hypothetical protein HJG54_23420 [Leptolyngbya sp. NK1-12]
MDLVTVAAIAYGILAFVGGILGYTKANSQTSLISGVISGVLLMISGLAHQQNLSWGLPLAIGVTIALIAVFAVRFAKTRKFMPAGLMVIAGILALVAMAV